MDIRAHIEQQIANCHEILADNPYSAADFEKYEEVTLNLIGNLNLDPESDEAQVLKADFEAFHEAHPGIGKYSNAESLLDKLQESLAQDLVEVKTRYIACDSILQCPAGFHLSDRVFVQPTIAFHFDDLEHFKRNRPACNVPLKVYDVDQLVSKDEQF